MKWHTSALPAATVRALKYCAEQTWLRRSRWYLAGGTALALQVGHRRSVDLDFFLPKNKFSSRQLISRLPDDIWQGDIVTDDTIYGKLYKAKVSFIAYPFFHRVQPFCWFGNVRVLDFRDIAVMKIIAISQRGRKRDFLDLYWYIQHQESLIDVLLRLPKQYPTVAHDYNHILKSLVYFTDAEHDPMPQLYFSAAWPKVKQFFQREVGYTTRQLVL
ncbi:MAG: nucleotidyl transferase AbiEii/AbiGii toxin family protein [Candidatus Kerfeldbacteria bacterium]|nr:nucleotidyl transferase AbiEii/AbiGii toxin family protein [Candidatus Kerfeldbacteria bacterium]